jgi:hypothetical protein
VFDVRWDCLSAARVDYGVDDGLRASHKAQLAVQDDDPTPRPPAEVVRDAQSGGHRVLVPLWSCPDQLEPVGEFSSVAERTTEQCPVSRLPSFGVEHPWSKLEGWTVTHVLAMTAGEFSNPLAVVIAVEANDGSIHFVSGSS